jgi:hypothetical protein
MDTAAFREACVRVFRGTYFPSPDEFLAGSAPDPQEEALDQWDLCQRIMEGERQVLDRMTERGRRAVALLGGPALLGQTPVDRVGWVRREFLATYRELVGGPPGARCLPGPEVTPESRRIAGIVMGEGGDH